MAELKTQIASGVWSNPAIWDPVGVPAIGDSVASVGAFDLTVDDDTGDLLLFTKNAGSGTLTVDATKTLDTTSYVSLSHASTGGTGTIACGGNLTIGSAHAFTAAVNIEMTGTGNYADLSSSPGGANLEINTAGTVTLATDVYCVDFTMTAGTLLVATYDITASGSILYTAGTAVKIDMTMTGTGIATWPTSANALAKFTTTTDSNTTLSGNVFASAFDLDGTVSPIAIGSRLQLATPSASGWWTQTEDAVISASLTINGATVYTPVGCISLTDADLTFTSGATLSEQDMDCNISLGTGDLYISGRDAGDVYSVDLIGGVSLSCGDVILGRTTAVTGSGTLTVSGMASMATISDGNAANSANAFSFGPGCHVEFSGLGDFANIAVTASTNLPPEIVCGPGGKVTNCEPDNEIALFGDANVNDTPGTNNLNITNFVNNQSYPGSLMTMGIGGGRLLVPFLLMAMVISCMMMKGMC